MGIIYSKQLARIIKSQVANLRGESMIDFENAQYLKLAAIPLEEGNNMVGEFLVDNEQIVKAFRTVRDCLIFTDRRLITANVQGVTGSKIDFSTLPYSTIQAFSIETASSVDLDCEMALWFAGLGMVKFELAAKTDIFDICKLISNHVLI